MEYITVEGLKALKDKVTEIIKARNLYFDISKLDVDFDKEPVVTEELVRQVQGAIREPLLEINDFLNDNTIGTTKLKKDGQRPQQFFDGFTQMERFIYKISEKDE